MHEDGAALYGECYRTPTRDWWASIAVVPPTELVAEVGSDNRPLGLFR